MLLDHSFPRERDYVQKNRIPLVIPAGTVEYHGPHCSYGCDTLVAEGLIKKLADGDENAVRILNGKECTPQALSDAVLSCPFRGRA